MVRDEELRALERNADAGDVGAKARLVLLNRKVYAGLCGHWLRSKRLWVDMPTGQQHFDAFCLYCGLNMDRATDDYKPLYYADCDTARRTMEEVARKAHEQRLVRAARDAESMSKAHAERVAALKAKHAWLRDVPDDQVYEAFTEYRDTFGGDW